MEKYLTAIIMVEDPKQGRRFLKYHNIKYLDCKIEKFKRFAANFSGAMYINFYGKENRKFIKRVYIN